MAAIHLIEGPVGAGKSTFALRLAHHLSAPHLDLDQWMVNLFRPDRPEEGFMEWYANRKQRCIEQIWQVACSLQDVGLDAVLELGLVTLADREDFYRRIDASDFTLRVYLLEPPKAERLARVHKRNSEEGGTFKMQVTDEVFEIANSAWQPPQEDEVSQRNMQHIADSRAPITIE